MKTIDSSGRLIPYQKSIHGLLDGKDYRFPTRKVQNDFGETKLAPYPRSRDFKTSKKQMRRGRTVMQKIQCKDGSIKTIWHFRQKKPLLNNKHNKNLN